MLSLWRASRMAAIRFCGQGMMTSCIGSVAPAVIAVLIGEHRFPEPEIMNNR
jgi:hypothetical protein